MCNKRVRLRVKTGQRSFAGETGCAATRHHLVKRRDQIAIRARDDLIHQLHDRDMASQGFIDGRHL